tara:strand:- start:273 stop:449 length:177 start_codon:yes stop_codon:yes gene_type:complete
MAFDAQSFFDIFIADVIRFRVTGYSWFFGWWNGPKFACNLEFFFDWFFEFEKDIAQNR